VDDFKFESADDISLVPPEDFSPDDGSQGEGGALEDNLPADNGDQQNNTPEDKHFTQADVDRIIGERLSRERGKYQGADSAMAAAHRMQEIMGMSIDDIVARLEEEHAREQAEATAKQMGVDPQTAQMLMAQENRMKQLEMQNSSIMQQMRMKEQLAELKDAPYFQDFEQQIFDVAKNVPGVDLKTAYHFILGQNVSHIVESAATGARQKTLAELQKGNKSFVEGSATGGDSGGVSIPREMLEMAKVYGVTPKRLAERMAAMKKR
jgi:hypothetical protein